MNQTSVSLTVVLTNTTVFATPTAVAIAIRVFALGALHYVADPASDAFTALVEDGFAVLNVYIWRLKIHVIGLAAFS